MQTRIAIDVGGTFTDAVRLDPDGSIRFEKVPTTPSRPGDGVMDGFARADVAPADVLTFTHGSTLGLNALLTRTGARTAVIATRGFRDIYLLGRTARPTNFDIFYSKPPGLVERHDTFEVTERMRFGGVVHTPFDEQDARRVAEEIGRRGYDAIAVAFLHSYSNPSHEQAMRDVLTNVLGDVEITISSDLAREYREYERTSTAVLDAYIKPIMRTYLERLQDALDADGFEGQFLMMRSGGGAMTASSAREQPVNLILSGPAGGVVGAAALAKLVNEPNLVTIDMGGTSLDASLIVDGEPVVHHGAEFEGLPINTSSLYIHTIGAGGGSIAWLDEAGGLQVGPQSAGADPGPAAYGQGGTEPTFTDAALVMGYLGAETPLGGTLTLDVEAARAALQPMAEALHMSAEQLAAGIVRISTTKITGAVRAITVDLGRDPKDFSLLGFGGAGGLVAVDVARELGISKVIIPPGQGAFSALGMLMADVRHDTSRTAVMPIDDLDSAVVARYVEEMSAEAHDVLARQGFGRDTQHYQFGIDARYAGQEHSVTVPLPDGIEDPRRHVEETFAEMHERQYGHGMDDPVEVTTFRLHASGLTEKPDLPAIEPAAGSQPTSIGQRPPFAGPEQGDAVAIYNREELRHGHTIAGPAVVVEHTATTVLRDGDDLTVGARGEMVISLRSQS